jgi:hypothetical protein
MKKYCADILARMALLFAVAACPAMLPAQPLVHAKDGSGVYGNLITHSQPDDCVIHRVKELRCA